jgi:hypothetical protein
VLALAGAAGCGQNDETHLQSRTWTLFEIQAASHSGGAVAIGQTLPAGIPASALMSNVDGADRLNTLPCFGDGKPCSWVTLEMRVNVPDVWLQPIYAVVTANADGSVTPLTQPLLADVGPGSTFYSPFWELNYAVVPAGTDPDHFTSTRQLFEEHAIIKPIAPHTCPLRPLDVRLATDGSQDAGEAEGMINGAKAGAFDFGAENFRVGPDGVIEELPFFKFVKPGDDTFAPPNVAGVGPLFSGRPADVSYNATGNPWPRFGAWWRVYAAIVPATAGAFHAASLTAEQMAALALKTDLVLADYEGRVAVDGACFADPKFPASCLWLDSQASVEAHLGTANLIKTEITGVCPLVRWANLPVKRP